MTVERGGIFWSEEVLYEDRGGYDYDEQARKARTRVHRRASSLAFSCPETKSKPYNMLILQIRRLESKKQPRNPVLIHHNCFGL